ncbi:MAG: LPS assembly lipoprotein LptE [Bacteroidales bacterium]|nr:LPS assembly lipoprotein LptE [Bacteroidales bacterium]
MKKISLAFTALASLLMVSCKVSYSFTGTSIQADVNTIYIEYFDYKALTVNPTLSNQLTEELRTRFRRMTRLEQVDAEADLELSGSITGYSISATAISSSEQATQNRLTIAVEIDFVNNKHPEDNVKKSFSQYADFPATTPFSSVESSLCTEIVDKLIEDIFNATVAQW